MVELNKHLPSKGEKFPEESREKGPLKESENYISHIMIFLRDQICPQNMLGGSGMSADCEGPGTREL